MNLSDVLTYLKAFPTHAERRRLTSQGAIRLNDKVVTDINKFALLSGPHTIQVGKNTLFEIYLENGEIRHAMKRKLRKEKV